MTDQEPKLASQTVAGTAADDMARDSLHLLPLGILPLKTPGLKRARLVRNARMETAVEVFKANGSGSGQVHIEALPSLYVNDADAIASDIEILMRLSELGSFDVYSLRLELRRLGLPVEDHAALTLSSKKRGELNEYLRSFTKPLIETVYGGTEPLTESVNVIDLIARPNREEAMRNIQTLAAKLKVEPQEIPAFLESYGDIFLSLAYFRAIFDNLLPEISAFKRWVDELRDSFFVKGDAPMRIILDETTRTITEIARSLTGRFAAFDQRSQDFWQDISAERFHEVRQLVVANHVLIGTVLCGLTLKMDLWRERFPKRSGGPQRRQEFVISEIIPGLDRIRGAEAEAAAQAKKVPMPVAA